jgi:hypothetical protein
VRWIAWLVVAACSGGPTTAARPAPIPRQDPAPAAEVGPSERDCDALVTHAVALGIDEAAARADAPPTTQADHEAVRRSLRDDFLAGCRALPHGAFRCALAAPSLTALAACQRTPRSSTSNSSVAPGGIAPPAPRSP